MLHMLDQTALSRVRLPVGDMTKVEVRKKAAQLGFRTAHKPDSQDICFVTSGDYRDFIRQRHPEVDAPGKVLDANGVVVGRHPGTAGFTIGQRKGLGVAVGEARYVVDITPSEQTITIGTLDDLLTSTCTAKGMSWTNEPARAGDRVGVKVRYRSEPVLATVTGASDTVTVEFDTPLARPAPGQAMVLYDGEYVLGGGTIQTPDTGHQTPAS